MLIFPLLVLLLAPVSAAVGFSVCADISAAVPVSSAVYVLACFC